MRQKPSYYKKRRPYFHYRPKMFLGSPDVHCSIDEWRRWLKREVETAYNVLLWRDLFPEIESDTEEIGRKLRAFNKKLGFHSKYNREP